MYGIERTDTSMVLDLRAAANRLRVQVGLYCSCGCQKREAAGTSRTNGSAELQKHGDLGVARLAAWFRIYSPDVLPVYRR
jgi:hypothetical protein